MECQYTVNEMPIDYQWSVYSTATEMLINFQWSVTELPQESKMNAKEMTIDYQSHANWLPMEYK